MTQWATIDLSDGPGIPWKGGIFRARNEEAARTAAGHPYAPENTLWEGPKHRRCRECNRIKCRRKHLARKAKN